MAESLFGPTVDEVQKALRLQDQQQGLQFAQLRPGRGTVAAAGQAGGMLSRGISGAAGVEPPEVKRAKQLQEIKEAIDIKGIDVRENPVAFYDEVIKEASSRGATDIVQRALQMKQEFQGNEALIGAREADAAFKGVKAREILKDLSVSNEEKIRLAGLMEKAKAEGKAAGSPIEFQEAFGAIDTETGERMVVLRTNRGLVTQSVGENGQTVLTPVDSSRIRQVRTEETGTSSDLGLGKTEAKDLRNEEVATVNFINTANDAISLIEENPDINTWTARAASFVNDLRQEAEAFGRGLGLEIEADALDPSTYSSEFEELGVSSRRMQSLITSLAFQAAAASGSTGRAVSDKDVVRFVKEIGANSADPEAFKFVLRDLSNRIARNFRTSYERRVKRPYEGNLGLDKLKPTGQQEKSSDFGDEEEALINKYLKKEPTGPTVTIPGR